MPKGVPNKRYTPEFKKMVVEAVRDHHMSYAEAEKQYDVAHGRIQKWERIYLTEGAEGFEIERRGRGSKGRPSKLPKDVQRLRAENAYLKKLQALVLEEERHQSKKQR